MRSLALSTTLLLLLALAALAALCVGAADWQPPWVALAQLWHGDAIIAGLRAPRIVLASLVGSSLALAGAAMQTLLRNDLADPYILGLSGGASVGAVTSLALFPQLPPGPLAAVGAAGAAALVRTITRGPYEPTRVVLGGVAVGALLMSVTGLVLVLAPSDRLLRPATFWLFGGMSPPQWRSLIAPAVLVLAALLWLLARAERLDRLSLGEDVASALGVEVRLLRLQATVIAVVLTASAVAVGGLVGFVGLVAPHAARRLVGAPHRRLLPAATLLGALLVLVADTIARTAFDPIEVPVGLMTAAVGGPFFLWQLGQGRRR